MQEVRLPEAWHWFPIQEGPLPSTQLCVQILVRRWISQSGAGRMASERGAGPARVALIGISFLGLDNQGNAPSPSDRKEERPGEEAVVQRQGEGTEGSLVHWVLWKCFFLMVMWGLHAHLPPVPPLLFPSSSMGPGCHRPRDCKLGGSF